MNDRREPTISGLKVDIDDHARSRQKNGSRPSGSTARPSAGGANGRPVVVKKSPMAPFAFFLALVAGAGCAYLFWQLQESQKQLQLMNQRVIAVEESLKLTDSESTQTVGAINDSLKLHFSEIDKLWAAYRKHKNGITQAEGSATAAKKLANQAESKATAIAAEVALVSDLVDAQQSALSAIETSNAETLAQARKVNEKNAQLERNLSGVEQRVINAEKDIEAINVFRRSVNEQLLQLKAGTQ